MSEGDLHLRSICKAQTMQLIVFLAGWMIMKHNRKWGIPHQTQTSFMNEAHFPLHSNTGMELLSRKKKGQVEGWGRQERPKRKCIH